VLNAHRQQMLGQTGDDELGNSPTANVKTSGNSDTTTTTRHG
jgi:hypothetical protein